MLSLTKFILIFVCFLILFQQNNQIHSQTSASTKAKTTPKIITTTTSTKTTTITTSTKTTTITTSTKTTTITTSTKTTTITTQPTTKTTKVNLTTSTKQIATSKAKLQDSLNSALSDLKALNRSHVLASPEKILSKSLKNMRTTTDAGYYINQIASAAFNIASLANSTANLTIDSQFCPYIKYNCNSTDKYRSYDGSCNNLINPLAGSANTPFRRILAPAYGDGFNSPRTKAKSGKFLPNPRVLSLAISPPSDKTRSEFNASHIYAIFGQFLIHDMSGTASITDLNGNEISCPCGSSDPNCFSVEWPANDVYLNQNCMEVARSSATFPDFSCSMNYREQLNLLSSFIDGSAIYGMNENISVNLRTFSSGTLKTSKPISLTGQTVMNGTYLPFSSNICSGDTSSNYKCFMAGEYRTSENLALVSIHTLFNREHNRIAEILSKLNPSWNDEKIYQEARRLNIAQLQHIVYNEWLTHVSGESILAPDLKSTQYYTKYNKSINPALSNEFSTAAFRFGHSLVGDKFARFNSAGGKISPVGFNDVAFKSNYAYQSDSQGILGLVKGTLTDKAWKFGSFGFELQNRLFADTTNNSIKAIDLLAMNIQRGRDHGLQPYIEYVKYCHNIVVNTFDDLKPLMFGSVISNLSLYYSDVSDIDLYVGGLLESRTSDSAIASPTFRCMILKQFDDLKNSDRFYYENGPTVSPYPFSIDQLLQIKNRTIAGLLCDNYDLGSVQKSAFIGESNTNPTVSCALLKNQIDLIKWIGI